MIGSGVDGVLCNYGVAKHYRDVFTNRIPVVLRLDGGESVHRSDWLAYDEWRQLFTVEDAVSIGADAVFTMTFVGGPSELDTLEVTSPSAAEAGLPLMVEALPCKGERVPDPMDPDVMASAARLAFEHGADLIKNYYTGRREGYRKSVEATPIPTLPRCTRTPTSGSGVFTTCSLRSTTTSCPVADPRGR